MMDTARNHWKDQQRSNMKNLVWFMVLFFFVQSCVFSNCKKKDLPKSEKAWFKGYKVGQKYVYMSNTDRTDTLRVLNVRDVYSPCNKIELGEFQFNKIDVRLRSDLLSKKLYGDIQFMSSIDEKGLISRSFYFIDLSDTYQDLQREVDQIKVFVPKYQDSLAVYTFNHSNAKTEGKGIIQSFSWSKEHGIVRYETTEGEVFELVK